jgi:hypothetical protein
MELLVLRDTAGKCLCVLVSQQFLCLSDVLRDGVSSVWTDVELLAGQRKLRSVGERTLELLMVWFIARLDEISPSHLVLRVGSICKLTTRLGVGLVLDRVGLVDSLRVIWTVEHVSLDRSPVFEIIHTSNRVESRTQVLDIVFLAGGSDGVMVIVSILARLVGHKGSSILLSTHDHTHTTIDLEGCTVIGGVESVEPVEHRTGVVNRVSGRSGVEHITNVNHVTSGLDGWLLFLLNYEIKEFYSVHVSIYNMANNFKGATQMNMKDFHAWVKAGDFDKPKMGDDSMHTRRLQQENKNVLDTINKITKDGDQRVNKG